MLKNKLIPNKQIIYLSCVFVILFLSYSTNLWRVANDNYRTFDRPDEANVIGRLDKSANTGFFSYGMLTGVPNYWPDSLPPPKDVNAPVVVLYDYYMAGKPVPSDKFHAYKSQTGGQAIMYAAIQEISPFSNRNNLRLFRTINAALVSLCFVLFIGWCYRNFGFISSLVTFILILLSPYLVDFGFNLWWALWSFYIPFVTMALLLEKKYKKSQSVSDRKVLLFLFIAVFVKCIFTGFEFISSALVSALCPVIFYGIISGMRFRQFTVFFFKAVGCAILGVLAEMLVLITQIRFLLGTFMDGVNHILFSYTKRSEFSEESNVQPVLSILRDYLGHEPFKVDFWPVVTFGFGTLAIICFIFGMVIFIKSKNTDLVTKRRNMALIITMLVSIAGPASWIIIFKEHASWHTFLDYIVWYMPFLLYGFLVIGQGVTMLIPRVKDKDL